jgi:hypothetical protein
VSQEKSDRVPEERFSPFPTTIEKISFLETLTRLLRMTMFQSKSKLPCFTRL